MNVRSDASVATEQSPAVESALPEGSNAVVLASDTDSAKRLPQDPTRLARRYKDCGLSKFVGHDHSAVSNIVIDRAYSSAESQAAETSSPELPAFSVSYDCLEKNTSCDNPPSVDWGSSNDGAIFKPLNEPCDDISADSKKPGPPKHWSEALTPIALKDAQLLSFASDGQATLLKYCKILTKTPMQWLTTGQSPITLHKK